MHTLKPWVNEIPYADPSTIFRRFAHLPYAILLESAKQHPTLGRFSFIGFDPFCTLNVKNGFDKYQQKPIALFDEMAMWSHHYPMTAHSDLPPFQGGMMGFWAYECGHYLEKLSVPESPFPNTPDCIIGCYDLMLAFDHVEQTAFVIASGYPENTVLARKQRAEVRLNWAKDMLKKPAPMLPPNAPIASHQIQSNFTAQRYETAVKAAQDYILAGDIFEVNLSQCFQCEIPAHFHFLSLYERLKVLNPAPFAGFFQTQEMAIISSSPERFIQCANDQVTTCPIKGTAKRSLNQDEDKLLAEALEKSEKDRAENIMIVDLMRNDLSRVCLPHTVTVPKLCELQTFETVHHLVSTVKGQLSPQFSAIDLLKATFPGGSITGAPKIRSMEIITELEQQPRGPYCGSLGYVGFDGNLDTSIAIRTFTAVNKTLYWQAGGAITVESDPKAEYLETIAKASALTQALLYPV